MAAAAALRSPGSSPSTTGRKQQQPGSAATRRAGAQGARQTGSKPLTFPIKALLTLTNSPRRFHLSTEKHAVRKVRSVPRESSTAETPVPIAGTAAALAPLAARCTASEHPTLRWLLTLPSQRATRVPKNARHRALRGLVPCPLLEPSPLGHVQGTGSLRRSDRKSGAEPSAALRKQRSAAGSHAPSRGAGKPTRSRVAPEAAAAALCTRPGVPTRPLPPPPPPDTCGKQPPIPLRKAQSRSPQLRSPATRPASPDPAALHPSPRPATAPGDRAGSPRLALPCCAAPHRPGRAGPSSRTPGRSRGPGRGCRQHRAAPRRGGRWAGRAGGSR